MYCADEIKCEIPWISPGFTAMYGEYVINLGDRPFKFAPPSDSYVSVQKANLENLELFEWLIYVIINIYDNFKHFGCLIFQLY